MGFLIDPFTETVTDIHEQLEAGDGQEFLDHVRRAIQARQLDLVGIAENLLGMFIDNFGLLRGAGQRYWRFRDGQAKVAGRALILAIDPTTGFLAPIRADSIGRIRDGIEWLPDVSLLRVDEIIIAAPGEAPRLVRRPVFSDDRADDGAKPLTDDELAALAPPPPAAPTRWVVSASASGVKAVRYELAGDELRVAEAITAKDLEELRPLLPGGLVRLEPEDDDDPSILEYLVTPQPPAPTPFDREDAA